MSAVPLLELQFIFSGLLICCVCLNTDQVTMQQAFFIVSCYASCMVILFFFERTNTVWLFLSHQYLQFAAITCLLSTVACEPDGELIDPASAGL